MGAVVSNGIGCAEVGGNILDIGGSAADAVIATMLCEEVVVPHALGIGGGFVATIYTKETGSMESLIARETAPAAAKQDMFMGREEVFTGAIDSGVPGQIYGLAKLHEKYGRLPWKSLFQPAINLCRQGIEVSENLSAALVKRKKYIWSRASLAEIFINPKTDNMYRKGEIMYRHRLANTLEILAEEGAQAIYGGGSLGRKLVEDIQEMGGIITEEDLKRYNVRWERPLHSRFHGYELYTSPLPTSGAVLIFILNVMEPLFTNNTDIYWHRLIETFKHAYGRRSNLADIHYEPDVQEMYENLINPAFAAEIRRLIRDNTTFEDLTYYGANFTNVEDHGTAHISVLAPNGDAISVTSSINADFGAKVRSRQTGIILNGQMDDFSTPGKINYYNLPPNPFNYIKPGKRPLSSMCPSIVLDSHGNVKLIVGGAGGATITTTVSQTILKYLVLHESIEDAVNGPLLHHQLVPMIISTEHELNNQTIAHLEAMGHRVKFQLLQHSAQTAIGVTDGKPEPVCDQRRYGSVVVVKQPKLIE
ncbi:hypothetical protein KR200_003313 [Drosophila serrata]|nr:hypothetical protein KR200_003313 [Drosophila serrata]